ncbi:MFS transporter [Kouleothrix sp.]|uniref:MFS transporter n=1 Tax=Kouleothrix sp. TaxID=2779161 RepID=UPI0039199455
MQRFIGEHDQPAAKKRALGLIFMIMLLDIIGLTIIIPVAPFIVQRFSSDAFMVTALTGIYAAAQFLAAPAIGKISDRVGRRPVLLVCVFGSAIGYFIFGVGGALWVLLLARVIDGISGGNMSTAGAYIADISTPEERPANFGLIGMAFGLGFIVGPALGGALSQISIDAPAFAAGVLALASVALIYAWLPESLPPARRQAAPMRAADFNPLGAIAEIARKPGVATLLLATCVFAFAFDGMNSALSVYLASQFAAQPWQIGALFVVSGLVTAVMQAALVPRVVARMGERRMAVVSQIGLSLGALVIALAPALWWLYPNVVLISGVGGFVWATTGSLLAGKVRQHEQGQLAGVSTALQSLMTACGPLAAGLIYDSVAPSAPFWLSAALFLLAGALLLRVRVPATREAAGAAQSA